MKTKLSLTLDEGLVDFVDSEAGASRSEKIEAIVRRYRQVKRDGQLRKELAAFRSTADDDVESAAWRQVLETAQRNESDAATSGRSRSPRTRNRGRR